MNSAAFLFLIRAEVHRAFLDQAFPDSARFSDRLTIRKNASRNANLFPAHNPFQNSVWYCRTTGSCCSVSFSGVFPSTSPLLSSPSSAMAHSRPLADAVTSATRASLRLVNSSTELLSISQLLAMDSELRTTLAAVHVQIRAKLSGAFSSEHFTRLETHISYRSSYRCCHRPD